MDTAILSRNEEREIEKAYIQGCSDLTVSIFDIPKIFAEGRRLLRDHRYGMELRVLLRFYVMEHCNPKVNTYDFMQGMSVVRS